MGDQTNHYLYGFGLTYCLTIEGSATESVKKCYYRYLPLCAKICKSELDEVVLDCGYDNRIHPQCQKTWRVLQRCMKSQGFWPDLSNVPPPRSSSQS